MRRAYTRLYGTYVSNSPQSHHVHTAHKGKSITSITTIYYWSTD